VVGLRSENSLVTFTFYMLQLTNVVEILQTHVSKIPKLNSVGENLGQYIDAGDWQTATIQ